MGKLLAARLGQAVFAILVVSVLIWSLLPLTPGDPAERILRGAGLEPPPGQIEALRRELGLDRPLYVQYRIWMNGLLHGKLGTSYRSKEPVEREIGKRIGATLMLTAAGVLVAIGLALPLALLAARFQDRWPDHVTRGLALIGTSIPSFWLGLLLLDLVAVRLQWTTALAKPDWGHVWLPALVLGLGFSATLMRLLRAGLLAELGRRYALVARARGAGDWRVLLRHALPNALLPAINALAIGIGALLGGAAIIETVFTWPGMGLYIVGAIGARDLPVVQGFAVISAVIFITVNLCADLLSMVLDPRLRHQVQY